MYVCTCKNIEIYFLNEKMIVDGCLDGTYNLQSMQQGIEIEKIGRK
jgi:hypothetical protein